jgi:long-subunit fatty acid transport protein
VRRLLSPFVIITGLAFASVARANPWDLYGFNPRALAMASAHTAFADDFTAVYYNPAALTMASEAGFGIGFSASRPNLSLRFDKTDRTVRDLAPPRSDGFTFGSLFPLGGRAVKNRVVFGLAFHVPTRSLLNGQSLDPQTPHWYMYQSLPSRLVAMLGVGVLPFDWLSFGASVQFLAGVTGSLDYELDIVAGRFSRKNVVFDIEPQVAPLFGLEVRPFRGLRFGFNYRASIQTNVSLPVALDLTSVARFNVMTAFNVQYTPHQFCLGASYAIDDLGLRIAADATYALWSKAPDPSVDSSIQVGGDLIEGTGLGSVLNAPAPGQERKVQLGFRDIIIPRIGIEKDLGPFALRAGYALRPSPAPLQTSGTNYVDATTHQLSIGAGYAFKDPFDLLANQLVIDIGGSLLVAATRHYQKVDPDDPVGAFEASGNILVLGAALRYGFREAPSDQAAPAVPSSAPGSVSPAVTPDANKPAPPPSMDVPEGDDPAPDPKDHSATGARVNAR